MRHDTLLRDLPPVGAGAEDLVLRHSVLVSSVCYELLILRPCGHDSEHSRPHAGYGLQVGQSIGGMAVGIENAEVPWKPIIAHAGCHIVEDDEDGARKANCNKR